MTMTCFALALGVAPALAYVLFPRSWAPALTRLERLRSGLRTRSILVQGRPFCYWEGGNGPAVIMIHGFAADKDHWTAAARCLRRRFRVLAVDLPAFGATPAQPDEPLDVRTQAAHLRAFLAALGIEQFHLVGNSMGGHVAGVLAHDFPGAQSLTLVECHGVHSQEPSLVDVELARGECPLLPATPAEFARLVELAFVRRPLLPRAVLRALCARALARRPRWLRIWSELWGPHAYLLESLLPGLNLPTLLVWADTDHFFHRSALDTLQRGLPQAEVVLMERCGHTPMFERPAEFASHVARFVDRAQAHALQETSSALPAADGCSVV